jgi:hypothetical protein
MLREKFRGPNGEAAGFGDLRFGFLIVFKI